MNWQINATGTRDAAKEAIAKEAKLSPELKAVISKELDGMPQELGYFKLSAISHDVSSPLSPGKIIRQISIAISAS